MDHLRPGIRLMAVVGDRDGIDLAHRVVALQDAARVLPRDRRAGLDLGPGDLGVPAAAGGALGNDVVDAAAPLLVARLPALDRRILDSHVIARPQPDPRGVTLALFAPGRRTAFHTADTASAPAHA